MESIKEGSVFEAKGKLDKKPRKFRYNKLIRKEDEYFASTHSITSFESGNTFDVENEWFRQRIWDVVE